MKATDLMLNDLVLYRGDVAKVIAITANGEVSLLVDGHIVARFVYAEELSPITLTAKILGKNGFHYNNPDDCPIWEGWEQYGWILFPAGYGYSINCGHNVSMRINAVNDLQHALRLCGIEKEVVL